MKTKWFKKTIAVCMAAALGVSVFSSSAFAAEVDPTTILENIMAAGVPEDVINYVLNGGASAEEEAELDIVVE